MPKTVLARNAMPVLFDSSVSPLPSRVAGAIKDRHLIFAGPDFDMHLKIFGDERKRELHGQIIPHELREDSEPATITLCVEGESAASTTSDKSGEFEFREIQNGDLALDIMVANRRVAAFFSL